MSKKLWETLRDYGVVHSAERFKEIVMEEVEQIALENGWTGDELLCHPTIALKYVERVRSRVSCPALPEEVICRTPINIRRRGGGELNIGSRK